MAVRKRTMKTPPPSQIPKGDKESMYSSELLSMLRSSLLKSSPPPAEDDVIIPHLIRQITPLSQLLQMGSRAEWLQSLNNLHRERGLNHRLLAVTGSASDSPWSRSTDKHCIFIKNRPATSSHNKQGCLSLPPCLSLSLLSLTSCPDLLYCDLFHYQDGHKPALEGRPVSIH